MHASGLAPERLVQRLRLRWPASLPPPGELTWRSRAEDALRTAGTSERSRVVFVRRVALTLPADVAGAGTTAARALHAPLERSLQAAVELAVPAGRADAARADAVWFDDWDAVAAHLLNRWLDAGVARWRPATAGHDRADPGEDWVMAAISRSLPAWLALDPAAIGPLASVETRVATVWTAWLQAPASGLPAADWALGRWRADSTERLGWLAEAARRLGVPAVGTGAGVAAAGAAPHDDSAQATALVAVLHHMVERSLPDWTRALAAGARSGTAGAATAPAPSSGPTSDAGAKTRGRVGLRFDSADPTLPWAPAVAARTPPSQPKATAAPLRGEPASDPDSAGPRRGEGPRGGDMRAPATSSASPCAADEAGAAGSRPTWAQGELVPTQLGGLVLLLSLLQRLGYPDWLAARPDERQRALAMAPFRIALAHAGRRGVAEPAWDDVLAAPPGGADSEAAGLAWLRRAGRAARAWGCGTLRSLLWRRAGLVVTRTHLDVVFRLDQVDLAVRRAALDSDPGWVPWLGRIVNLHFEPGDPWTEPWSEGRP